MSRGGMSKSAFGGRKRLDKIDLLTYKRSIDAPEKIIFQQTILDAANNYLFFGIAEKNGTSLSEFWFAYEYFYRVRSSDPKTWPSSKLLKTTAIDESLNKRTTKIVELTDAQMKAMCFDMHFYISNIKMSIDSFLNKLNLIRTKSIEDNWPQIKSYIISQQTKNHAILNLKNSSEQEWKKILISPESPEELVKLVGFRTAENKNKVKVTVGNT
jgi:hypothetical protein